MVLALFIYTYLGEQMNIIHLFSASGPGIGRLLWGPGWFPALRRQLHNNVLAVSYTNTISPST